jgi:Fe-S-cluster containining protein
VDVRSEPFPDLDVALLGGFEYACRPGCGLCCFATPRATAAEVARLRAVVPAISTRVDGTDRVLAARPNGGACELLRDLRCSAHTVRPHPCREFPVTVHVGERLQASVVLTCPGVDLAGLRRAGSASPPVGFDPELASIRSRFGPSSARRREEATRRRRTLARRLGETDRWVDEATIRAELASRPPLPGPDSFPVDDLPEVAERLEALPLYPDRTGGPRAIGAGLGGWELLALRETGGADVVGVGVPPTRRPSFDRDAEALLVDYLRYTLARDAFLASVAWDAYHAPEGNVLEWTVGALEHLGAVVLSRAHVRAQVERGDPGTLGVRDLENGIRATDQEWLDRPGWGDRF